MSLISTIAKVASIAAPVLVGVLKEAVGTAEAPMKKNPATAFLGPIRYFFDEETRELKVINVGDTETTLSYVTTENETGVEGNVVSFFLPLNSFETCSASRELTVFRDGNVGIADTEVIPPLTLGESIAEPKRARILLNVAVLTVSNFLFFGRMFQFRILKDTKDNFNGFRIDSESVFDNARLRFKNRIGSFYDLDLEVSGGKSASAPSPLGSDIRLPLEDVEISLDMPREAFDEVTKPIREQRQVTRLDKNDVPAFLLT